MKSPRPTSILLAAAVVMSASQASAQGLPYYREFHTPNPHSYLKAGWYSSETERDTGIAGVKIAGKFEFANNFYVLGSLINAETKDGVEIGGDDGPTFRDEGDSAQRQQFGIGAYATVYPHLDLSATFQFGSTTQSHFNPTDNSLTRESQPRLVFSTGVMYKTSRRVIWEYEFDRAVMPDAEAITNSHNFGLMIRLFGKFTAQGRYTIDSMRTDPDDTGGTSWSVSLMREFY